MPRQLTSNEHLDYIAALLDDMFRIPGTQIRFGLDALIGWVPGIGDALAGIASFLIVVAAWRRGVQAITLVRMIANVVLETTLGAIPVAGDVFHVFWKANRRNYKLLIREREQPGANAKKGLDVPRHHLVHSSSCGGDSDCYFDLDSAAFSKLGSLRLQPTQNRASEGQQVGERGLGHR
jgi:hypothetical protein